MPKSCANQSAIRNKGRIVPLPAPNTFTNRVRMLLRAISVSCGSSRKYLILYSPDAGGPPSVHGRSALQLSQINPFLRGA